MSREDTLRRFETIQVDADEAQLIAENRSDFRHLAEIVLRNTWTGREQSLALTALEEALMWVNKSIALHGSPVTE